MPMTIRNLIIAFLLIVLTSWVFRLLAHHPFTELDDAGYVLENRHVLGGWSWKTSSGHSPPWRIFNRHPLTWLSHMTDVQLFGLDAGRHHLVNLRAHRRYRGASFLLGGTTGAWWRSGVVAALFGVHSLHVESVAWVAERKTS